MGQCSPGPIDEELLPVVFELVCGANSLIGMESEERRRDQRYNMKFLRLENMEKKELSDTEERRKKSGQIMQKGQTNANRKQRDTLKRNQQDDNSEDDELDDLSDSVAEDTQEAVDWQIAMKGKENVNWIHPLNMSGRYKYRKEEPFEFQMHIEQVKSAFGKSVVTLAHTTLNRVNPVKQGLECENEAAPPEIDEIQHHYFM
ncbi:MAG: hypothetical protein EZS28_031663 [Streblomastix strix]|uniref:Uncharacterized protein n=1 Tax=Streblomastix strix TaxID=222440 RepID=A0A5J4US76_9EUKA|nr:MAG: hypothetical protein EZS28_031663 [Streblomastix strix]